MRGKKFGLVFGILFLILIGMSFVSSGEVTYIEGSWSQETITYNSGTTYTVNLIIGITDAVKFNNDYAGREYCIDVVQAPSISFGYDCEFSGTIDSMSFGKTWVVPEAAVNKTLSFRFKIPDLYIDQASSNYLTVLQGAISDIDGGDDPCASSICGDGTCRTDCGESSSNCPGDCPPGCLPYYSATKIWTDISDNFISNFIYASPYTVEPKVYGLDGCVEGGLATISIKNATNNAEIKTLSGLTVSSGLLNPSWIISTTEKSSISLPNAVKYLVTIVKDGNTYTSGYSTNLEISEEAELSCSMPLDLTIASWKNTLGSIITEYTYVDGITNSVKLGLSGIEESCNGKTINFNIYNSSNNVLIKSGLSALVSGNSVSPTWTISSSEINSIGSGHYVYFSATLNGTTQTYSSNLLKLNIQGSGPDGGSSSVSNSIASWWAYDFLDDYTNQPTDHPEFTQDETSESGKIKITGIENAEGESVTINILKSGVVIGSATSVSSVNSGIVTGTWTILKSQIEPAPYGIFTSKITLNSDSLKSKTHTQWLNLSIWAADPDVCDITNAQLNWDSPTATIELGQSYSGSMYITNINSPDGTPMTLRIYKYSPTGSSLVSTKSVSVSGGSITSSHLFSSLGVGLHQYYYTLSGCSPEQTETSSYLSITVQDNITPPDCVYNVGDGICCDTDGETCSNAPGDCGTCPVNCDGVSASWLKNGIVVTSDEISQGTINNQYQMRITGIENADGMTINFDVWEYDFLGSDDSLGTFSGTVSGTTALVTYSVSEPDLEEIKESGEPPYKLYFNSRIGASDCGDFNKNNQLSLDVITPVEPVITRCGHYLTLETCRAYDPLIAKATVEETGIVDCSASGVDCYCYWNNIESPEYCDSGYSVTAPDGSKIGSCNYDENMEEDDCSDGFLSYSWTVEWIWDPVENPGLASNPSETGYVQDSVTGLWHYDPQGASLNCNPGHNTIVCPAKAQLTGFVWWNLIIALVIVILIYWLFEKEKKKNKKNNSKLKDNSKPKKRK